MLCRVTMSGMRWSVRIHSPAMSAYHVWACATSASPGSRAMVAGGETLPRRVAPHGDALGGRLRSPLAEAAHVHRHATAERARQLVDDDTSATIDVRRILAREHEGFHWAVEYQTCEMRSFTACYASSSSRRPPRPLSASLGARPRDPTPSARSTPRMRRSARRRAAVWS